jgi:hypothetical protein
LAGKGMVLNEGSGSDANRRGPVGGKIMTSLASEIALLKTFRNLQVNNQLYSPRHHLANSEDYTNKGKD